MTVDIDERINALKKEIAALEKEINTLNKKIAKKEDELKSLKAKKQIEDKRRDSNLKKEMSELIPNIPLKNRIGK
jgi:predicted  nucleic acid-binding Zn-ribbon protein